MDAIIYQILEKFQELFNKTIIQDKSKELLAVENLTLESDTLTIIRLCKDLLTITRGLRETWCLGTMKVTPDQDRETSDAELEDVYNRFSNLTVRIAELGRHSK